MTRIELQQILKQLDNKGIYIFTRHDLEKCFSYEPQKTIKSSLARHVQNHVIEKICRGIYINPLTKNKDGYTLERIAIALKRGYYSYVSLESLLAESGRISQIPISLLTVMTTGRSQKFKTSYGRIEFTHTKKSISEILHTTHKIEKRPLRLANIETAIQDLHHVNRNTHLIEEEENV